MENAEFSVIIPTHNRPGALTQCLESFLALDHPVGKWELIVVNDGGEKSFDGLTDVLHDTLPLQIVDDERRGPAAARNRGAKIARGEYLAFTDDDCRVEKNWLTQFASCFQTTDYHAIVGQVLNPYPQSMPAVTWEQYLDFLLEYFEDVAGNLLLLPSNNVAYRKSAFDEVGGYDESFPLAATEDLDIGYRLAGNGYRSGFCPVAKVWHRHNNTYRGYLGQQFRYGRGAYYFHRKRRAESYVIQQKERTRGEFYKMLAVALWRARAPLPVWLLNGLTPFAYGLGRFAQAWLHPK